MVSEISKVKCLIIYKGGNLEKMPVYGSIDQGAAGA